MQRLTRLTRLPPRAAALAMVKETGTPVDFTHSREIDLQKFCFLDMTFGMYAYQGAPVIVDAATRDAFVNGNLEDLQVGLTGQGMPIQYMRISWNESREGENYRITDMVVGYVVKVSGTINTGPAYAIDALKKVEWFNNLISKLIMPWKAWELLEIPITEVTYRWIWGAKSDTFVMWARLGEDIPPPPPIDETRSHFVTDGNIGQALGEFVRSMLDSGYEVTILGYKVHIAYERIKLIRELFPKYRWGWVYRTHTRLSVDYRTSPEVALARLRPRRARLIAPVIAYAIAAAIIIITAGVTAGLFLALQNLTTTERGSQIMGPVPVPGTGEWVTDPETGEPVWTGDWEWGVVEESWEKGPPDWWADVIPTVVLGALIIFGAVIVVPPIIRSFRG